MTDASARLMVHVIGEVNNPGVYQLTSDERVVDAVRKAGGFTKKADQERPNLAAHVTDGEQIIIPRKGAVPAVSQRFEPVDVGPPVPLSGTLSTTLPPATVAAPPATETETKVGRHSKKESPANAAPISLSTASSEELQTIPGVGPATAEKIVNYRAAHGSFQSVDELRSVGGIGAKKLEKIRPYVTP